MNGLEATNAFFDLITAEITPRLEVEGSASMSHWMIISDAQGIAVCWLDDETAGMAVDSVLARHLDGGASAAAFLTVRDQSVLAQVLIAEPRNSDLRRAALSKVSGELRLGPWMPEL